MQNGLQMERFPRVAQNFSWKRSKKDWKTRKTVTHIFKHVDYVLDVHDIEFNENELWIKKLEKFTLLMFVITQERIKCIKNSIQVKLSVPSSHWFKIMEISCNKKWFIICHVFTYIYIVGAKRNKSNKAYRKRMHSNGSYYNRIWFNYRRHVDCNRGRDSNA